MEIIYDAEVKEIFGGEFVTGLKYLDKKPVLFKNWNLKEFLWKSVLFPIPDL